LTELIEHPARLFGTTLIGVNAALQIGSECARRFYESINIDPDFAPLSQVILVVLFGELIPLFSARRHPEPIAMALAPFMILISRILTPLIWAFSMMAKGAQRLVGKPTGTYLFLSREEVQKAFEENESDQDEFSALASRVFHLKNSLALQSIAPIHPSQMIPSNASIDVVRHQLSIRYVPFFLIYHRDVQNIVAIADLRDLLHLDSKRKILDVAKPPWFVTQDASLLQILEQFRRNNQSVAVILDTGGQALGLLTFDQIIDAVFGPQEMLSADEKGKLHVERTVMGTMTIEEFNQEFLADFPFEEGDTLSDMLVLSFSHHPVTGESVEIGDYEFTVLEPSLRGAKVISVKTVD
jgi:CBS domain containing-hemolysin-like protein